MSLRGVEENPAHARGEKRDDYSSGLVHGVAGLSDFSEILSGQLVVFHAVRLIEVIANRLGRMTNGKDWVK